MNRLLIGILSALLVTAGVATAESLRDDGSSSARSVSLADVPGPCDEAEHIGDPRCTGAAAVEGDGGRGRAHDELDDRRRGRGEDNSGRGRGHSGDGEDRSGPNRGSH